MSMVVQHNLQAMNSNRMLGITTSAQSKSTEKLSSGYRINRAADDAAGLTISEKMRKQMRGLDRASTNAQDGVSAVQTAEGALTEVHSMLQRMNELAVQASNGTNSQSDRDAIQAEIEQLTTEIDRVSETTKFNEIYLLKGNAENRSTTKKIAAHDAGIDGKLTVTDSEKGESVFELADGPLKDGDKITIGGVAYTIGKSTIAGDSASSSAPAGNAEKFAAQGTTATMSAGDTVTSNGIEVTVVNKLSVGDTAGIAKLVANSEFVGADGKTYKVDAAVTAGKTQEDINTGVVSINTADISKFLTAGSVVTKIAGTALNTTIDVVDAKDFDNQTMYSTINNAGNGNTAPTINTVLAAVNANNANVGTALAAGDSTTIGGTTTTYTQNDPATSSAVADAIDAMDVSAGAGSVAITYADGSSTTIAIPDGSDTSVTEEQIAEAKQKAKDALAAGAEVVVTDGGGTAANYSIPGGAAASGDGEKVVDVDTAYALIEEALKAASSIGTDEGSEATVTNNNDGTFTIKQGSVSVAKELSFSLHVGADADMTNKIIVDIDAMSAAGLGVQGLNVSDETGEAATYAIDAIADAIAKVSSQRSALGAVQNRLEHTIANLDNVVENTTAAESRIRDTDMAEEMVEYSKNNILAQAGQSMLAQANQSTQGVLSLLG